MHGVFIMNSFYSSIYSFFINNKEGNATNRIDRIEFRFEVRIIRYDVLMKAALSINGIIAVMYIATSIAFGIS